MPTEPTVTLLAMLVAAFVLGQLAEYLNIPHVLGYITAGFLLGFPLFQQLFTGNEAFIQFFTDIGLIALFFFVGLGMDIGKIDDVKSSLYLGVGTQVFPFFLGAAAAIFLGYGAVPALIIGVALSISAQAVTVEVLQESGNLDTRFGRTIVGAGVVGDIVQLLGISLIFGLLPAAGGGSLLHALAGWLGFFLAILLLKLVLIPLFIRMIPQNEAGSVFTFTGAFILALLMGILGDVMGVSSIMGALFAGIVVRRAMKEEATRQLADQLKTIAFGFFIPVFFVWMGTQVGLPGLVENIGLGALFLALSVTGALIGAVLSFRHVGESTRDGLAAGWALQAKGDVELVIAAVAIKAGIITAGVFNAIVIMSAFSMILSPLGFHLFIRD